MKRVLLLLTAALLALLFNLEWDWRMGGDRSMTFTGPNLGLATCAGLMLLILHWAFRGFQDLLIARGDLTERIRTPFDVLPGLLIVPLAIGGGCQGETWTLDWGLHPLKLWYFIALLGAVFAYQVLTLVRRMAHTAARQPAAP